MRIEVAHTLGVDEAGKRLRDLIKGIEARPWWRGVEMRGAVRRWENGLLDFSINLSVAFFDSAIKGRATVSDTAAVLDSEIPGTVVMLVGEDPLRNGIEREMRRALKP